MSYFGAAAAASSVRGPGLLVQAVGDGEERNVVVPQLRADSLREHPEQQRGPLEIHLVAKHGQRSQIILRFDLGSNMHLHVLPGSRTFCFGPSRR